MGKHLLALNDVNELLHCFHKTICIWEDNDNFSPLISFSLFIMIVWTHKPLWVDKRKNLCLSCTISLPRPRGGCPGRWWWWWWWCGRAKHCHHRHQKNSANLENQFPCLSIDNNLNSAVLQVDLLTISGDHNDKFLSASIRKLFKIKSFHMKVDTCTTRHLHRPPPHQSQTRTSSGRHFTKSKFKFKLK